MTPDTHAVPCIYQPLRRGSDLGELIPAVPTTSECDRVRLLHLYPAPLFPWEHPQCRCMFSTCFLNVFSSTDSKHTQFWFSTNTLMTWKRKEMRLGANNTPLTPRLPEHSEGSHLHPHAHCSDQCDVCYANHLICTTRHSSKGGKQSIKSLAPKSMRENKKQKQTGKVEKN